VASIAAAYGGGVSEKRKRQAALAAIKARHGATRHQAAKRENNGAAWRGERLESRNKAQHDGAGGVLSSGRK